MDDISKSGDDIRVVGSCGSLRPISSARMALAAALELYRGDFLADFSVPDAEAFEEWVDAVVYAPVTPARYSESKNTTR